MGKHQLRLLRFAVTYRGWHPYGTDKTIVQTIHCLVRAGLFQVNARRQFRLYAKKEEA